MSDSIWDTSTPDVTEGIDDLWSEFNENFIRALEYLQFRSVSSADVKISDVLPDMNAGFVRVQLVVLRVRRQGRARS